MSLVTSYTFTTVNDSLSQGLNGTEPVGINNEGQIIGWYQAGLDGPYYGFLYSDGSYTTSKAVSRPLNLVPH
jgi:probable HAF family extracellular repeat protein